MGSKTALRRSCVLWHRLEDAGNSEIGPNPIETGTVTFSGVKFGNGADNLDTATNFLIFPNAITTPNNFIMDFWWKPNYNQTDAGLYALHRVFDNGVFIIFIWHGTLGKLFMSMYSGGYITQYHFPVTFAIGSLNHVCMASNKDLGAGLRHKLYFNGSLVSPSSIPFDSAWNFATMNAGIGGNTYDVNGSLDNLKINTGSGTELENAVVNNNGFEGFKDDQAILL